MLCKLHALWMFVETAQTCPCGAANTIGGGRNRSGTWARKTQEEQENQRQVRLVR